MSDISAGPEGGNHSFPLTEMPMTAIQAIYHHVTGKTENMKQDFDGNVSICSNDVDRLHQMILDQIATHHVEFGPTVTVEVKHANDRAFHHSSWEHYKSVVPSTREITSEMTLKFELVLNLQGSVGPQRCVINILLDSSLPMLLDGEKPRILPRSFWIFASRNWKAVTVSIDFVDFMIARGFLGIVEEWFKGLTPTPSHKLTRGLIDKYPVFSSISSQMGRIGFAIFLASFIYTKGDGLSLRDVGFATCAGLVVWSLYLMLRPQILDVLYKRITSNVVPTVLLLSEHDKNCYDGITRRMKSTSGTLVGMVATVALNAAINLSCSYLYSYMTGK